MAPRPSRDVQGRLSGRNYDYLHSSQTVRKYRPSVQGLFSRCNHGHLRLTRKSTCIVLLDVRRVCCPDATGPSRSRKINHLQSVRPTELPALHVGRSHSNKHIPHIPTSTFLTFQQAHSSHSNKHIPHIPASTFQTPRDQHIPYIPTPHLCNAHAIHYHFTARPSP